MKSGSFRAITTSPLNGAPPPAVLVRAPRTPVADFFIRNHGAAESDAPHAPIVVAGLVRNTVDARALLRGGLSRVTVEASLQCAGNRRDGLSALRPIRNELPWDSAAIGNAVWEGVRLADVLAECDVNDGAAHVWFEGGEALAGAHAGKRFGASIPLAKALAPEVILADTMNGVPLPAEHGAPLRVVVPGYIGARSVKWLAGIRVERNESPNHFQRAYSVYPPHVLDVPAGGAGGVVMGEFPLSSAFGDPVNGAIVSAGRATLRGWSIARGAHVVAGIEVSADGGATWTPGAFTSAGTPFVWRLWEAHVELPRGEHELVCRATDDAGHTQPASAESTWNVRGYANNAWDRVRVRAE